MSQPSMTSRSPPTPSLTPRPPTSSSSAAAASSPSAPPSARIHTAGSNAGTTATESPLDALLRSYTSAASSGSGNGSAAKSSSSDSPSAAFLFGTGGASSALSSLSSSYPGLLEQMRHASSLEAKERKARSRVLASGSWKKILTHVIENTKYAAHAHLHHASGTGAGSLTGPASSRRTAANAAAANAAAGTLAAGSVAATLDGARRALAAGGAAGDDVYGLGGGYNPLAKSERLARSHRFGGVLLGGGGSGGSGGSNADSSDGSGGAGSTGGARLLREPDTEDWANWSAEDWRNWRECRAREKDRQAKANAASILSAQASAAAAAAAAAGQAANGRSSATGDRASSALGSSPAATAAAADAEALLYTAASKLKLARDDLKSSMDLNYDLNPLDHVHTIRHTRTHGQGGRRGGNGGVSGADNAALTKQRTLDARFERDQKSRAAQLYRNIWLQQMKVMKSNRSLQIYAEKWDRKLSGYKLTLERDAQGNRIRAWHQMDEKERAAVVAAQNGTGGWDIEINAPSADDAADSHRAGDSGSDDEGASERPAAAASAEFSASSSDDDDGGGVQSASASSRRQRRPGSLAAGGASHGRTGAASHHHLQASSNPHKHVYQGAAPSGSISSRSGGRDATTLAELAASTAGVAPLASLSARAHASAIAAHQPQSTFEAMLNAGVQDAGANGSSIAGAASSISAAQQQQQQAAAAAAANTNTSGSKNRASLFHRAILSLKSRHLLLSWEEREQHELKDLFDLLARDRDGYSKMTKASFKAIVLHNFAAAGNQPVGSYAMSSGNGSSGQRAGSPANGSQQAQSQQQSFVLPPPRPLHLDRLRLDPLLDRIWLAINSAGRSANFLDLADFTQMLGLALQGSLEDRAAFAFELFDLDDDGVIDIHDLFLGLHLGLDELFPRDFRIVAENLYGRMESYEAIWERRQQRVTNHAARERTRIEAAANKAAAAGQGQSASTSSLASMDEEQKQSPSPSPKSLRLNLSHITDAASSAQQPLPRAVSPYVHQELPVLHITKAEFIKLHSQAYVFSVETNRAAAAAAAAVNHHAHFAPHDYPMSARPASGGHHHPHGAHHAHTGGHGQGQGQAAFRAATIALHSGTLPSTGPGSLAQFSSASMYVQSSSGAASHPSHLNPSLPHSMPLHSLDVVEMLAKAFFLPYRKSGGRLGNSPLALAATGGIMGSGPPRETSQHAHAAAMMAAAAAATSNANTAAATAAREKEKERTMAAAGSSKGAAAIIADEKSNAPSSSTPAPPVGTAATARGSGGGGRHHARRSIQSMDDLRSSASAAESSLTLQSPPAPRPPKAHRSTASGQAQSSAAADNVLLQPPPSEVDTLLLKLRAASSTSPGARVSKAVFKRLLMHYLSTGANHQFHELNPSAAQADLAEEERVVDFLFFALDSPEKPGEGGVGRTGTVDGHYAAAMLSFVLRGDSEAQLLFFHRLLDLDKDGLLSARDLCMAHDVTTSYCLRTDLRVLLDVFSTKIEQVITHSRTSAGMAGGPLMLGGASGSSMAGTGLGRSRQNAGTGRDVYPDPPAAGNSIGSGRGSRAHSRTSSSTPGGFSRFDHYADPATAAERAPMLDMALQLSSHRAAGPNATVGISLAEFHDALLKFNPSFFLKILRRVPYPREKRTFVAASARHPGQHATRKKGAAAAAAAGGAAAGEGAASGSADSAATGAASSSGPNEASFDELHHLHRSLMHDLQVSTMIDFSACFPDAHNAVIGEQILTLRRSLEFQNDCAAETRVFYVASRFLKPPPPLQAVTLAMNNLGLTTGGVLAAAASATPTVAQSMEHAYSAILRLLTRVPQVYVQWTLLQDGSKHSSVETAKFRRAAAKYNLVSKAERQKARYKMVATPGQIYAYGGFPRPKANEAALAGAGPAAGEDRAELQHYGTPLRCILLSVTGAQLNEEGLDDLDFLRVDPESQVKYLDQPALLFELIAQTHMWLQGFVEMVELENSRAASVAAGAGAKGKSESAALAAASALAASAGLSLVSSSSKPGLLRVVRIGAGNFAAVPGMKEHQGALVAYLLMHAFLINLQRNAVTTLPPPPPPAPVVTQPAPSPRGAKHRTSSSNMSASATAAAAAAASQPAPVPVTTSCYRNLSVLEFIFFDESACPVAAGADGRRMCGGVELRFSRRDVLELTTAHTSNYHIGILNPTDGFALPGNEEGYTSLASMMGNNTSLRLHQGWHFNVHLLQQANYVPVEMPPIREASSSQLQLQAQQGAHVPYPPPPDADALAADLWSEMAAALVDPRSPNPWPIERVPTPLPEPEPQPVEEAQEEEEAEEEDELLTLRTDE